MISKHYAFNVNMDIQFHQIVWNVEEIMTKKKTVMDVIRDIIL